MTLENPPGLYGTEDGVFAHNLLDADAVFAPLVRPADHGAGDHRSRYAFDELRDLKGPLVAAALALMLLDTLAVFWMGGLFARRPPAARARGCDRGGPCCLGSRSLSAMPTRPRRRFQARRRRTPIEAISKTRIAYVLTGEPGVDSISRAGLNGLSRFLIEKTALEPGEPAGVDIAKDELVLLPAHLLADRRQRPDADRGRDRPHRRIYAAGRHGSVRHPRPVRQWHRRGFDAVRRRSACATFSAISTCRRWSRCRHDHVLTKSFYILPEFPGRFSGSPLWVEASLEATTPKTGRCAPATASRRS